MFSYHKRLLFPVYTEQQDKEFARELLRHFCGRDSEIQAFFLFMNQRISVNNPYIRDLLGMIAAEELSHWEMIGVAVNKLGLKLPRNTFTAESRNTVESRLKKPLDSMEMLRASLEMEERTRSLYEKHRELTEDPNLRKMLQFLADREAVHLEIIKRTIGLISEGGDNESYARLIHDYRRSMRVVK